MSWWQEAHILCLDEAMRSGQPFTPFNLSFVCFALDRGHVIASLHASGYPMPCACRYCSHGNTGFSPSNSK